MKKKIYLAKIQIAQRGAVLSGLGPQGSIIRGL